MKTKSFTRQQNLLALGFPASVAKEAGRAADRNRFALRPSADLIERTIDRCKSVFEDVATEDAISRVTTPEVALDLAQAFHEACASIEIAETEFRHALKADAPFWQLGTGLITARRLASAIEAVRRKERPLTVVDNHSVVNPVWWEEDSGLSGMRRTCSAVDSLARRLDAPRLRLVVVPRPRSSDYTDQEISSFGSFLKSSSCDVWVLDHRKAGVFQDRGAVVGGGDWAMTLAGRPNNAAEAVWGFKEERPRDASTWKSHVENTTAVAVRVRVDGQVVGAARDFDDARSLRHMLEPSGDGRHVR